MYYTVYLLCTVDWPHLIFSILQTTTNSEFLRVKGPNLQGTEGRFRVECLLSKMHKIQPCPEHSVCCLFILPVSNSFPLPFSDAPDVSVGTEYPDDFEEVELEEDDEGEAASAHGAAPRQLSDDVAEEE